MVEIGITDIRKITTAVKEHYGYDFSNHAHSSMMRRLSRLLERRKIPSVETMIEMIHANRLTVDQFLGEINVSITEMFRDPSFWRSLRPILNDLGAKGKIKIWIAGCSTGEELYSMLILLNDLNLLDKAQITATDMADSILDHARSGKVLLKSLELNASNYRKVCEQDVDMMRYFRKDEEYAFFDKELISNVHFHVHDLSAAVPLGMHNLILCRNVLVYFNQTLHRQVLEALHGSLQLNGFLAIGSKENLNISDMAIKFSTSNKEEKVFKKIKDQ